MEGQGQFQLEPEPNVAGMLNEPTKGGLLAEQSAKFVRTLGSPEPQTGLSLMRGDALEGWKG